MQAIVGRLEGRFERLFERLGRVNYERLFVVSVLVVTLTGSLYVYLLDFYFARSPDQAVAVASEIADRVAPIGRVTLAEPLVAAPAQPAETAAAAATDATAAENAVAEASASAEGSSETVAMSETPTEPTMDPSAPQAAVSTDPIETRAVSAEPLRPAQVYPPVPPGYMPWPVQGFAPVYPHYQPTPAVPRQAPGARSWYAPGPYQAYPPTFYERSAVPPAGYPQPPGWVR
ncbi:hypothetical protein [Thiocapsa sp.]|uniref:hypothetical protein n=1 Tax=Thiocapsa sp. TaxID=2024551 RepID=UPI003593AE4E